MLKTALACVAALASASSAYADSNIEFGLNGARVQNYNALGVAVFYIANAGSCASTGLFLKSNFTADDQNRWWSALITAKTTNQGMGIFFDPSSCQVSSFYLK